MACRIGITTDTEERKRYWQSQCRGFRNWRVIKCGLTKSEAQAMETQLAKAHGCDAHPGGPDSGRRDWCVYVFDHDGCSS